MLGKMMGGLNNFILNHKLTYINGTKRAGWDNLYEDCFQGINQIVEDNLKGKHNKEIINEVYVKMLEALHEANEKMKEYIDHPDAKPRWTDSWYQTFNNIIKYSKSANNSNKKVIIITMIDQFLRATF